MSNKVRYGLKNAYYATVTISGSTVTFGTVKPLPGAVAMNLEPQGESSEFYADDGDYFDTDDNRGYEGTLEMALIPESFETDCLGATVDNDGLIVESDDDEKTPFALLFEFTGDKKAIRHCLYYCTASRPTVEGNTKGESVEVKTEELTFKARPLPGYGNVKAKTSEDTDPTRYDGWYSAVALPDFPEMTVSPKSATWDGTNDVVLTVTGGTVDAVKLSGATVNTSNYTVSGTTVTIKSTYLATLAAGKKKFKLYSGETKNVAFDLTINASS